MTPAHDAQHRPFRSQPLLLTAIRSLETRDYALYRSITDLPFVIISDEETVVLHDEAELERHFDGFANLVSRCHPARLERVILAEKAVGASLVLTRFSTRLILGGRSLIDPFETRIVYRLLPGGLKAACVANPAERRMILSEVANAKLAARGAAEET